MIRLENFSIGYGRKELIQPQSLNIPSGQLTALIGRNGTGKSTMLRALAGLNNAYSGDIYLNEKIESKSMTSIERARTIAFVNTQRTRISNMTCMELVGMGRAPYTDWIGNLSARDNQIVIESLDKIGMSDYASRTIDTLSDGECQRVMIARALAQDTPIIILDEPTSFLDLPSRYSLVDLLHRLAKESGKCILFSTHELDIALRKTDNILLLSDHKLSILPSGKSETAKLVEKCFGLNYL
ncbi:MAG: ABC transporter ATP-binding protein [Muribaculaceae bacterium]|nr:ABC transporter ATP-binding protein [Muribaculaceae bacterium]